MLLTKKISDTLNLKGLFTALLGILLMILFHFRSWIIVGVPLNYQSSIQFIGDSKMPLSQKDLIDYQFPNSIRLSIDDFIRGSIWNYNRSPISSSIWRIICRSTIRSIWVSINDSIRNSVKFSIRRRLRNATH